MSDVKQLITEAVKSIDGTTDLFYRQDIKEGYMSMEGTLAVLSQTVDAIFKHNANNSRIDFDEKNLVSVLNEAMNAMEAKDVVLLSDILQYEIKELLEQYLKDMNEVMNLN